MVRNENPQVSVVVPVLNAAENLPTLLGALQQQTFPCDRWELIVVDNGSTDGSREILSEWARRWECMRVLDEKRRGPSAARNAGVRAARARILAFIDSDCVPAPAWLEELVRELDDRTVWAVGGLLVSAAPVSLTEAFAARQAILNQEDFFKELPYKPPFLLTANFAVRRAVFDRVGYFDEALRVGEDADFCWRILKAGGKLALAHRAIAAHRHRSNIRSFARQMFLYGIGSTATFLRHRDLMERNAWIDWRSYAKLGKACVKAVLYPFIKRDYYMRREGALEVIRYSCFLAGRIVGSIRHRVICV
ncbi:MAG: glycosyltransferase [Candidatus Sumerlaea chitinivorans]|jgi:glycosyltransferase involved in cell wall biosynthesis|nr:glycosyltransferase [Candidatus Sumerlaea chitinivorans]